jgi:hypothetical protein
MKITINKPPILCFPGRMNFLQAAFASICPILSSTHPEPDGTQAQIGLLEAGNFRDERGSGRLASLCLDCPSRVISQTRIKTFCQQAWQKQKERAGTHRWTKESLIRLKSSTHVRQDSLQRAQNNSSISS